MRVIWEARGCLRFFCEWIIVGDRNISVPGYCGKGKAIWLIKWDDFLTFCHLTVARFYGNTFQDNWDYYTSPILYMQDMRKVILDCRVF